ncbi:MAG TPA: hypothetical protein VK698_32345 [Kofleriaceae bacterium]|nr:hypothetical protein [Kofleriaceae bacterium]
MSLVADPDIAASLDLWLAAQTCVGGSVSRDQATSLALTRGAIWITKGHYVEVAICLEECTLTDSGRRKLEAMERGRGYQELVTHLVQESATAAKPLTWQQEDAVRLADRLAKARSILERKETVIGERAGQLKQEAARVEQALSASATASFVQQLNELRSAVNSLAYEDLSATHDHCGRMRSWIAANPGNLLSKPDTLGHELDTILDALGRRTRYLEAQREKFLQDEDLREQFCENARTLQQLRESVRLQGKIDQASGTVNLVQRRQLGAAKVILNDNLDQLKKRLRQARLSLKYARDCIEGIDQ